MTRDEFDAILLSIKGCPHTPLEPHDCSYLSDVNNDSQTLCRCCDDCQHDCAMAI